jgi:phosphatidylglycerophosphatase A
LAGFLFITLLPLSDIKLLVFILLLFSLGTWTSDEAERSLGKDSGHIVIDEFCGYLVAVLFVPKTIGYLFAAFVLFRLFDIFKPPPIRNIERAVKGGAGIMLDDVMAGIFANICIQVWIYALLLKPAIL